MSLFIIILCWTEICTIRFSCWYHPFFCGKQSIRLHTGYKVRMDTQSYN